MEHKDNELTSFRLSGANASKRGYIVIALFVGIWIFIWSAIWSPGNSTNQTSVSQSPAAAPEQVDVQAAAPLPHVDALSSEAPADIAVTSQTVKRVDGKYRYFFDIRNQGEASFDGTVKIELLQQNGNVLGRNEFKTNTPIKPGLGDSVFVDTHTGPLSAFSADFAITSYRFEATGNSGAASRGTGQITAAQLIESY